MKSLIKVIALFLFCGGPAVAGIVQCTTETRNNPLVPNEIEYEFNDRGTSVDVKDSTGEKFGRSWVNGNVTLQNTKRTSITWTHEGISRQPDWWGAGKIVIRMNSWADGHFNLTLEPTRANLRNARYEGAGHCRHLP